MTDLLERFGAPPRMLDFMRHNQVTLMLLLCGVSIALGGLALLRTADESSKSAANQRADTRALCTLRHDLQVRVAASYKFLADHPHGIPGISAQTIRAGASGQQRTIQALGSIKCK